MTKGNFICVSRNTTLAVGASADILKLRSGETVQGVFLGADSSQPTFQDPNEQPVTYLLGDVSGVTFAAPAPAVLPPPPPPPTPSQPKPKNATLLAGALIPVRMLTSLSTEQGRAGDMFTATLDLNLMVGNVVVARKVPQFTAVLLSQRTQADCWENLSCSYNSPTSSLIVLRCCRTFRRR
jgi:hypothetical protein